MSTDFGGGKKVIPTSSLKKTQMDILRIFVCWLGTVDAVETDLHTKVLSPDLKSGANVRTVLLEYEEAEELLTYLSKYQYASRAHVVVALM